MLDYVGDRVAVAFFYTRGRSWVVYCGALEVQYVKGRPLFLVAWDSFLADDNSVLSLDYMAERRRMNDRILFNNFDQNVICPDSLPPLVRLPPGSTLPPESRDMIDFYSSSCRSSLSESGSNREGDEEAPMARRLPTRHTRFKYAKGASLSDTLMTRPVEELMIYEDDRDLYNKEETFELPPCVPGSPTASSDAASDAVISSSESEPESEAESESRPEANSRRQRLQAELKDCVDSPST